MTASRNIQRLKVAVNNVLNAQEQVEFARIINSYFTTDDIFELTRSLDQFLDTPAKRQLIRKLRRLIPHSHVTMYDRLLDRNKRLRGAVTNSGIVDDLLETWSQRGRRGRTVDVVPTPRKARSLPRLAEFSRPPNVDHFQSSDLPNWEAGLINSVHRVQIDRSKYDFRRELGLSIRGGAEHGLGIYVSNVTENSVADEHGMMAGDQIMAVNGVSFKHISNREAVKIISSSRRLEFELCHVGRIPGAYETHLDYAWADRHGKMTSPPPEVDLSSRYEAKGERKSALMLLKDTDERKVNLSVSGTRTMGVMIRGGKEFGLGIYVSGVDANSAADHAGLRVGDQILDVNGTSFMDILHADAVATLKSSKRLILTVKDIGKIPYAMTTYDHTEWIGGESLPKSGSFRSSKSYSTPSQIMDKYGNSENSKFTRGLGSQLMLSTMSGQASQMTVLERKADRLLTKKELAKLRRCLIEYREADVSVDGLLRKLFQIFDTKAKLSLMTHIRSLIAPKDLDDFDSMTDPHDGEAHGEEVHQINQLRLFDSWPEYSLSSITSSSNIFHHDNHAVNDMEPLRKAIREISEFNGNDFSGSYDNDDSDYLSPDNKTPPWHQKTINPKAKTLKQGGSSQLIVAAEVHSDKKIQPNGISLKTVEHADKAVATEEYTGIKSFPAWSVKSSKTDSFISNSEYSAENYENMSVQPYYAQVRVRAVRHEIPNGNRNGLTSAIYSPENTESRDPITIHRQRKYARHKNGGSSNGFQNNGPLKDSVYELRDFGKDKNDGDYYYFENENSFKHVVDLRRDNDDRVPQSMAAKLDISSSGNQILYAASGAKTPGESSKVLHSKLPQNQRGYIKTGNGKIREKGKTGHERHSPVVYAYLHDDASSDIDEPTSVGTNMTPEKSENNRMQFNHDLASKPAVLEQHYFDDLAEDLSYEEEQFLPVDAVLASASGNIVKTSESVTSHAVSDFGGDSSNHTNHSRSLTGRKAATGELQVIKVYKTKPTLGIAIEGGADTRQPIPRIAKIQDTGSAYSSDLQQGQVLVAVNGHSLVGLEHEECAALIAKSFKSKKKAYVEFVIQDDNQHLVV